MENGSRWKDPKTKTKRPKLKLAQIGQRYGQNMWEQAKKQLKPFIKNNQKSKTQKYWETISAWEFCILNPVLPCEQFSVIFSSFFWPTKDPKNHRVTKVTPQKWLFVVENGLKRWLKWPNNGQQMIQIGPECFTLVENCENEIWPNLAWDWRNWIFSAYIFGAFFLEPAFSFTKAEHTLHMVKKRRHKAVWRKYFFWFGKSALLLLHHISLKSTCLQCTAMFERRSPKLFAL